MFRRESQERRAEIALEQATDPIVRERILARMRKKKVNYILTQSDSLCATHEDKSVILYHKRHITNLPYQIWINDQTRDPKPLPFLQGCAEIVKTDDGYGCSVVRKASRQPDRILIRRFTVDGDLLWEREADVLPVSMAFYETRLFTTYKNNLVIYNDAGDVLRVPILFELMCITVNHNGIIGLNTDQYGTHVSSVVILDPETFRLKTVVPPRRTLSKPIHVCSNGMIYVGTRDDTEFEILDENAVHIQSKSAGERGSELRFRDMIVLSPTDEIVLLTWNGISHVEGVDLLPAMVPDTKSARK